VTKKEEGVGERKGSGEEEKGVGDRGRRGRGPKRKDRGRGR
jgi:hypothetical protein